MKVLHVIPSLADAHGGPSGVMRLIERALRERGVEVETATTDDGGADRRNGKPVGVLLREEDANRWYFRRTTNLYKVSLPFARWILGHAHDYDLIHVHALFSFTSSIAALAARRAQVPYVVRPLGTLNRYGVTQRRPWLKRLSIALIEGRILKHAAAVQFTSLQEQREAESLGLTMRGAVIPLAVEPAGSPGTATFRTAFPALQDRRYVLFLSRLDPKKNVEGLLGAIRECASVHPDTMWVLAGDGEPDYVAQLHELATRMGVAEHVVWTGHLDGEAKAAAFAHAEVFVLPSYSENFGIAAAEALAAGVPCVLSHGVAICDELVGAGAALAVGTDPHSIGEAMTRLLRDEEMRADMSRKARKFAHENYSLAAMGQALQRLYDDVLARNPARERP